MTDTKNDLRPAPTNWIWTVRARVQIITFTATQIWLDAQRAFWV